MTGCTTILMKKYHDRTYLILTSKRFSKFQRSKSNFKSLFTGYLQYINRFTFNVLKNVVQLTVWWLYYVVVLLQDSLKIIGVLEKNRVNRAFDFRFVYVFSLVGPCRSDCQGRSWLNSSASKTSGTMSNQNHETFLNKYYQYLVCLSWNICIRLYVVSFKTFAQWRFWCRCTQKPWNLSNDYKHVFRNEKVSSQIPNYFLNGMPTGILQEFLLITKEFLSRLFSPVGMLQNASRISNWRYRFLTSHRMIQQSLGK